MWFVDTVAGVLHDEHAKKRSCYEDTGGDQGHLQLQQMAPRGVWFMAVVALAVDHNPRVTVTLPDEEPVSLEVIYEGRPHTDPDFVGAQLVYWVFASRTPFPENGKIDVLDASVWSRTFQGPRDMSLRACLRAVRDLFDICAVCNDVQQDPACKKCKYKGQRPSSPHFSPKSPATLSDGLPSFG